MDATVINYILIIEAYIFTIWTLQFFLWLYDTIKIRYFKKDI